MSHGIFQLNKTDHNLNEIKNMLSKFSNYSFKDFIISDQLISAFKLILDPELLTLYGFKTLFRSSNQDSYSRLCSKAFIIPPIYSEYKKILNFCSKLAKSATEKQLSIIKLAIFVLPLAEPHFTNLIEYEGLFGIVEVFDLKIYNYQFDLNVFGMFCPFDLHHFSNSTVASIQDIFNR